MRFFFQPLAVDHNIFSPPLAGYNLLTFFQGTGGVSHE